MISPLLAIDSGFAKSGGGCACTTSRHGLITEAWFERAQPVPDLQNVLRFRAVVWEIPQDDKRTEAVSLSTIIHLTEAGCALAHQYGQRCGARVTAVTPTKWKGSAPKAMCHSRLWSTLTMGERAALGGRATEREIRRAVEKGALRRWAPDKDHYYPKGWPGHNLLDSAAINKWATENL